MKRFNVIYHLFMEREPKERIVTLYPLAFVWLDHFVELTTLLSTNFLHCRFRSLFSHGHSELLSIESEKKNNHFYTPLLEYTSASKLIRKIRWPQIMCILYVTLCNSITNWIQKWKRLKGTIVTWIVALHVNWIGARVREWETQKKTSEWLVCCLSAQRL